MPSLRASYPWVSARPLCPSSTIVFLASQRCSMHRWHFCAYRAFCSHWPASPMGEHVMNGCARRASRVQSRKRPVGTARGAEQRKRRIYDSVHLNCFPHCALHLAGGSIAPGLAVLRQQRSDGIDGRQTTGCRPMNEMSVADARRISTVEHDRRRGDLSGFIGAQ